MLSYTPLDFPQFIPEERRARYLIDPTRRRRYASVHPRHRIRPRFDFYRGNKYFMHDQYS